MGRYFLAIVTVLFFLKNSYSNSFKEFTHSNALDFNFFSDTVEKNFDNYEKELQKAFDDYKEQIAKVWGEKNVIISGQKTYVSYFNKLAERNIIDFEKGNVKLELIISAKNFEKKAFKKKIIDSIVRTICQKPDIRSIKEIAKEPDTIEDLRSEAVLKDQIIDNKGNIVNSENAEFYASQIFKQKKFETSSIKNIQNSDEILISIDFSLIDDHIKKRALKYIDIVISESKKRKIKPELVFALIETESSFNPYAKSHVPAFGLMQLVPSTAGRDAYRLVFKKDKAPTDKFLYNPENNIELGSAYLYILFNRYLDEIENFDSRKWCVLAAYNTGIGNIFETFIGKYSKKKYSTRQIWKLTAFEKINKMTSEEVYTYLRENLKYNETRVYIKKIRSRIPKYKALEKL